MSPTKTVHQNVRTGTSRTPLHILIAQLGEHGKNLKNRRKYGKRWLFSSNCFLNDDMRFGKYFIAISLPANRANKKQKVAPDAIWKCVKCSFLSKLKQKRRTKIFDFFYLQYGWYIHYLLMLRSNKIRLATQKLHLPIGLEKLSLEWQMFVWRDKLGWIEVTLA